MKKFFSSVTTTLFLRSAAILVGLFVGAQATVLWTSSNGDLSFPGLTPTTIDNMAIGGTTPAAVSATTLAASGAVSGAGITARFAAPGPIGSVTPSTGAFTTASTSGLASLQSAKVDTGTKTATASSGAATLDKNAGVITTESLTTAGLADYTLTLTNATIAAVDQVMVNVGNGSNSAGDPVVGVVTPGAGSATIVIRNAHATAALNGTLKISFVVFKN